VLDEPDDEQFSRVTRQARTNDPPRKTPSAIIGESVPRRRAGRTNAPLRDVPLVKSHFLSKRRRVHRSHPDGVSYGLMREYRIKSDETAP